MKYKVVVYNNITNIAKQLSLLCEGEFFTIHAVDSRRRLLEQAGAGQVHLLILDIMMDAKSRDRGIELITELRKRCQVPIIVVASQKDEISKISALNMGADDYVYGDDNPLVLLARIRSHLRRYFAFASVKKNLETIYRVDGLVIDDVQKSVTVEGRDVKLTPIEYQILRFLVKESGKVHSACEIYEEIWKMQAFGADNTIAVHIRHIREKIEKNPGEPKYVKVVWGTGYMVG